MKENIIKTVKSNDDQNGGRPSFMKNFISKQVFVQQVKKKRKLHSNSILNQLKLNQKINQQDLLSKQQTTLRNQQKLRNTSLRALKLKNTLSELTPIDLSQQSFIKNSRFASHKNREKSSPNVDNESQKVEEQQVRKQKQLTIKDIEQQNKKNKKSIKIEENTFIQRNLRNTTLSNGQSQLTMNKIKKKNTRSIKPNHLLSAINNKIRQIDIISKTFDQVNSTYHSDYNFNLTNYLPKKQKKINLLQDFQSKLILRKNMITQRKNSLKKNTIIDYKYKAFPKRFKTQIDKENYECQYEGLWNEDARKLKNYISGGYSIEKEQFSDVCDLEDYRRLRKNFKTFDQIYSSIKDDKQNPVGKMIRTDKKNPNILQVVCALQKQQEIQ